MTSLKLCDISIIYLKICSEILIFSFLIILVKYLLVLKLNLTLKFDQMLIVKKKKNVLILAVLVFALMANPGNASAHSAPPCNDTNGDGSPSGQEYAAHHISALAKAGVIGQGHKPGTHQGFSVCGPANNP